MSSVLFENMPRKTRVILWIEIIVAVGILVASLFLLARESKAPSPTPSPSATPELSTYISSVLQIQLKYPYGWQRDAAYATVEGLERYVGPEGAYFRVDASNTPTPKKNTVYLKYVKPIKIGETVYKYFVLEADPAHLQSIKASVQFMQ